MTVKIARRNETRLQRMVRYEANPTNFILAAIAIVLWAGVYFGWWG